MYEDAKYVIDKETGGINGIFAIMSGVPCFIPATLENTDYANLIELEKEGKIVIQPADGTEQ
jgi:hypothetical protein